MTMEVDLVILYMVFYKCLYLGCQLHILVTLHSGSAEWSGQVDKSSTQWLLKHFQYSLLILSIIIVILQ